MPALDEVMRILDVDPNDPLSVFVAELVSWPADERWEADESGLWFVPRDYMIDADRLLEKRGDLYEWPLHLAEKEWVRMSGFLPMMVRACAINRDALLPEALNLILLRKTVIAAKGIRRNLGLAW